MNTSSRVDADLETIKEEKSFDCDQRTLAVENRLWKTPLHPDVALWTLGCYSFFSM